MANVLIVEDNESLRLAYTSFLGQEKHKITALSSVDEALGYLKDNTPDIILLDMLLPKKNGLNLLQEYDVLNDHPDVKVMAFSNYPEPSIKEEAGRLGAKLFLTKSLTTPKGLLEVIASVLKGQ